METITIKGIALSNYEEIKANLAIKLYHKSKAESMPIYTSAGRYGFEDLVMVPVINLGTTEEGYRQSAKVVPELVEVWGVCEGQIIKDALHAMEKNIKIVGMNELLRDMMIADGMPSDMIDFMVPETEAMYVVSNTDNVCGAGYVIAARRELKKRFPNGYVVLPSSIHEVIVMPLSPDTTEEELLSIVESVNAGVVAEEDKLADNVYVIK